MSVDDATIELLTEINERLRQLLALTAATQVSGLSQREAVEKLGSVGLSAKSISEITGFPVTSVAPALSRAKKGKQ